MNKICVLTGLCLCLFQGCQSFYREVEGVDVGVIVPVEDTDITAMHYLSGSKLTVKQPSAVSHEYTNTWHAWINFTGKNYEFVRIETVVWANSERDARLQIAKDFKVGFDVETADVHIGEL